MTHITDFAKANVSGKTYDGFITQHNSLRGMSGGPAFGVDGKVYGVNVATWSREIPEDNRAPTIVSNSLVVKLSSIKDVIEKAAK